MTKDMDRFIEAADALAEAALECHPYVEELNCGDSMRSAVLEYRAAREAITRGTPPAFATSA